MGADACHYVQEVIAYSLFGIFDVHLSVIYDKKQNTLGLLQEIIAQLSWIGSENHPTFWQLILPRMKLPHA
jgi:hypothetical protein